MKLLELDRKAQRDLILLAISGLKGRTMANKFLHELLLQHATKDPCLQGPELVRDLHHREHAKAPGQASMVQRGHARLGLVVPGLREVG